MTPDDRRYRSPSNPVWPSRPDNRRLGLFATVPAAIWAEEFHSPTRIIVMRHSRLFGSRASSLVEMVVVLAIITLLVGLLLKALALI